MSEVTGLGALLAGKVRKNAGEKTAQADGMKIPNAYLQPLTEQLGLEVTASGVQIFDEMVRQTVDIDLTPEGEKRDSTGLWIGRKLDLATHHKQVCEALGIPVSSGGVAVAKTLLAAFFTKKGIATE